MSVTIRVSPETHERLQRLATDRREPIGRVIAAAADKLDEDEFWTRVTADFARLHADPAAEASYLAKHRSWDVTLRDGPEDEPR